MNRIKEVLKQRGISQTLLAQQLGMSFNMINEYTNNRRQPNLTLLFEIAKVLNVSPDQLLKLNENESGLH